MFADDTGLFHSIKDINVSFLTVNKELPHIYPWFIVNKSLNLKKTKDSFFNKLNKEENISLALPKLNINNQESEKVESSKFLVTSLVSRQNPGVETSH